MCSANFAFASRFIFAIPSAISVRSPVAQALLGKREGESAVVMRPKGATEVTVVKVWYDGA